MLWGRLQCLIILWVTLAITWDTWNTSTCLTGRHAPKCHAQAVNDLLVYCKEEQAVQQRIQQGRRASSDIRAEGGIWFINFHYMQKPAGRGQELWIWQWGQVERHKQRIINQTITIASRMLLPISFHFALSLAQAEGERTVNRLLVGLEDVHIPNTSTNRLIKGLKMKY